MAIRSEDIKAAEVLKEGFQNQISDKAKEFRKAVDDYRSTDPKEVEEKKEKEEFAKEKLDELKKMELDNKAFRDAIDQARNIERKAGTDPGTSGAGKQPYEAKGVGGNYRTTMDPKQYNDVAQRFNRGELTLNSPEVQNALSSLEFRPDLPPGSFGPNTQPWLKYNGSTEYQGGTVRHQFGDVTSSQGSYTWTSGTVPTMNFQVGNPTAVPSVVVPASSGVPTNSSSSAPVFTTTAALETGEILDLRGFKMPRRVKK